MSPEAPKRVLIVDDDPMVGRIALAHVTAMGAEGKVTDNPDAFFAALEEWKPDVVMVDLVLGDMDGLDVLRRLAEEDSTASVIIASGVGQRVLSAARRFADGNGLTIAGVLAKPYRRAEFAALINASPADPETATTASSDIGVPWSSEQFGAEIDSAIRHGHINIALQPKLSCVDQRVVGYEVLARWHHAQLGHIVPSMFVPFAERTGRVPALTSHVLQAGLDWFSQHAAKDSHLSVNISAAELENDAVVARLRDACTAAGIDPSLVILELTETSAMSNALRSLETLTHLRLAGFGLSLDDFGMGYSSMEQLARMPFTELKVDKAFVTDLGTNPESRVMTKSIIELAHGLELEVTAEGVENAEAFVRLAKLGCDNAQGYHLGRPMSPHAIMEWSPPKIEVAGMPHQRERWGPNAAPG